MHLFLALISLSWGAKNPFRLEIQAPNLTVGEEASIKILVVVPPDHHLYRDMMWINVLSSNGVQASPAEFPIGTFKTDPANPADLREQYEETPTVQIPVVSTVEGSAEVLLEVRYQGCQKTICFRPVLEEHLVKIEVQQASADPKKELK